MIKITIAHPVSGDDTEYEFTDFSEARLALEVIEYELDACMDNLTGGDDD